MGAYATDFVERTWPVTYGGKGSRERPWTGGPLALGYPVRGRASPSRARERLPVGPARARPASATGATASSSRTAARPADPGTARLEALAGHFDPLFRSFDLDYPDAKRADRFLEELAELRDGGRAAAARRAAPAERPHLGHARRQADAAGVRRRQRPRARPRARGRSRTAGSGRTMAVFVVEDDAQNGPDHVDAHRTVALVAGPYVKRGAVVHDAVLDVQHAAHDGADPRPAADEPVRRRGAADVRLLHRRARTSRPTRTPGHVAPRREQRGDAWGAEHSERIDLENADEADDLAFSELVWHAVKGPDSPMPPPRRAAFVRPPAD